MIVAIEKRFPRNDRLPCIAQKNEAKCLFFPYKGAKISIFNCDLIQKGIVGRRLWRNLNWKIIILVLFVHVLVSWNAFFQCISSSLRSQSLYHFVWEALGFSLFVATRFLYVKLLGFFVFWKALVKDSTSTVSRLLIFSLNLSVIVFNIAIIPLKASGQLLHWDLFENSV